MNAPDAIDQECVEAYLYSTRPLRVLLFRRPPERGRIWVPVSGKVEATDRSLESAARRELQEETGVTAPRRVESLDWNFPFVGPDGGRWRLHAFAVEVDPGWVPTLSAEHDAAEWFTPELAVERLHYDDNKETLRRLMRREADPGQPALLPTSGPGASAGGPG